MGVAASVEHEGALRRLNVRTVVDVGANKGQFSLLMTNIYKDCIIHAFEPLTTMAQRYQSIFAGDDNVYMHQVAAGESPGLASINVSGHADSSSILPISNRQNELFPGTAAVSSEEIKIERIDDILDNFTLIEPVLIKLDVQGFELSALKGMPNLLERAHYVYVEISFEELYEGQPLAAEIIEWLAKKKFQIDGVYNVSLENGGVAVQADALFVKSRLTE